MNVEMFGDNILVKRREPAETRTPGGLVIPKGNQEVPMDCTVLALGSDAQPNVGGVGIKVGETVLVSRYAGIAWENPETKEKLLVVKAVDVLGRLPNGAPVDKTS